MATDLERRTRYCVVVGNIGTVHQGGSFPEAWKSYVSYGRLSALPTGRASGESVYLFDGDDVVMEHVGTIEGSENGD